MEHRLTSHLTQNGSFQRRVITGHHGDLTDCSDYKDETLPRIS